MIILSMAHRSLQFSLFAVSILAILQCYIHIYPLVRSLGILITVKTWNMPEQCIRVPQLEGCEKIAVHPASGLVYLACTSLEQRFHWLNPSRNSTIPRTGSNYLAIYNHDAVVHSDFVRHIILVGFDDSRTIAFHGLDVVPAVNDIDKEDGTLFIFLVHHRAPPAGQDLNFVGFDSSVEVFKTTVGSTIATHLHTFDSPILHSPNDVIGSPDGQSIFFTNDGKNPRKFGTPLADMKELLRPNSSVGYCHVEQGCKIAIGGLFNPNGIAMASNGTIYLSSSLSPGIRVLNRQDNDELTLSDIILTDSGSDNLTIDDDGILWVAAFPKALDAVAHMETFEYPCPHTTFKVGRRAGKYYVEKALSDDGRSLSFITTVAHDSRRGKLYFHGPTTSRLTVCEV